MTSFLEVLPRDMIIEILQYLHCKHICQLDKAITNQTNRIYLYEAYKFTTIKYYQITSQYTNLQEIDSFSGLFFPECLITLNVLGNLRHDWNMLLIKRTQINALQWMVDRKIKLKVILFDFCTEFDDEIYNLLAKIPSIETANCKNCLISNAAFTKLCHNLPHINKLSFHTRVNPIFVENLSNLCTSLHTLFLTFGYGSDLTSLGEIIEHCHCLEVLHIRKMHTASLPHNSNLFRKSHKLLHLNCEIDGGLKELETFGIKDNFQNLQTLILTVPNKLISDEFVYAITQNLKYLQWFGLRYAKVSKNAISYLLINCLQLKRLDIHCCRMNGNPFSTIRLQSISLIYLQHLEFVWNDFDYPGYVYSTHRSPFTVEEICEIIEKCPNLMILKCTDPGPHNMEFRECIRQYAVSPERTKRLQVQFIQY